MARPAALVAGLLLLAAAAALLIRALDAPPELAFRDRPGVAGFRTLAATGDASAGRGLGVLLGLTGEEAEGAAEPGRAALCRDLWAAPDVPARGPEDARPRLAVFSDANCPYCRVLDGILADLAAERPDLRVVHHEWPVLGAPSRLAARAALAAGAQGAFRPVQRRLLESRFLATPAYLEAVAEEEGLDPARLIADLEAPFVERALAATARAAEALGLRGTPVVVAGGTVAEGAVDRATLEALLAAEAARADRPCP